MSRLFGTLSGILVLILTVSAVKVPVQPAKYVVDLDLPEEQRWVHVMRNYTFAVKVVEKMISEYVPAELFPLAEEIAADIDKYLEAPYAGEIRGISKAFNVSVGMIVMANLVYDVSAFCTSIVTQDDQNQIWHARNLDYSFTGMLENLTIAVDFQKNGKTMYSMITYAGYIGALTGQRPNAFTVTVDERDQGPFLYNLIVAILDRQTQPVSFLVRDAIAGDATFEAAVERLAYTPTAAPVYFILGGVKPGEGAVITKGRLSADDIWRLDVSSGRWFLVETNYDHWTTPPPADDRRDPANKLMRMMGRQNISKTSLYSVMTTHPVLNNHTTYTVIMSAAQPDIMEAWIWGEG